MHEEVRKECGRIERVVPVDGSGVIAVESDLHDDGPDVDTGVQDDDSKQTKLSTASLAETLDIQDKTEAETANTGSKKKRVVSYWTYLEQCRKRYLHAEEGRDEG